MLPSEELISDARMNKKFSLDSAVAKQRHEWSRSSCVSGHTGSCQQKNSIIHEQSKSSENSRERESEDTAQTTPTNARVRSISLDSAGLVLPKKLVNPCMQSAVVREIHREIKWTNKKGISMLSAKTELDLALDRHRKVQEEKEKRKHKLPKNEFQRKLSEISGRLDKTEIEEEEGKSNQNGQKAPNAYLLVLNKRLSPGKEKCDQSDQNVKKWENEEESREIDSCGRENTKYSFKENRLESELERVFAQLRDGQKFI